MFHKRVICLVLALSAVLGTACIAAAAEVDSDSIYCFSSEDFSTSEDPLAGICITQLPAVNTGTVMLGTRVVQKGDILTAQQVSQMTFLPLRTEQDVQAVVSYLPIYKNRVEQTATMTLGVRGKEDKAPVAEDSTVETYKNLPNEGKLKVTDPEGQPLTFSLVRKPKRGSVELREDGSFVYTPKKNKVGVDSFVYTATDPAGKVSRQATVTVQILKPSVSGKYTDTVGTDCRFEAEWLRNTGIFTGEKVSGELCFQPQKEVTRGEFLAMVVRTLNIPKDSFDYSAIPAKLPEWLKPYLAAALRSGLLDGLAVDSDYNAPITGAEAAVILQNALDLSVTQQTLEEVCATDPEAVPTWASASLTAMAQGGIELDANSALTRAQAACALYRADYLSLYAPGTAVFRAQE